MENQNKKPQLNETDCWLQLGQALWQLIPRVSTFIVLLALIATGCVIGIFFYGQSGETSFRIVYNSFWFNTLLVLLFINLTACTIRSKGFNKRRPGMLITHLGVAIVLAGAFINGLTSEEAYVKLSAGDSTDYAISRDAPPHDHSSHAGKPHKAEGEFKLGFILKMDNFKIERHPAQKAVLVRSAVDNSMISIPADTASVGKFFSLPGSAVKAKILDLPAEDQTGSFLVPDQNRGVPSIGLSSAAWKTPLLLSVPERSSRKSSDGVIITLAAKDKELNEKQTAGLLKKTAADILEKLPIPHIELKIDNFEKPFNLPLKIREKQLIKEAKVSLTVKRFFPDFQMSGPNTIHNASDNPKNPAVEIEISRDGEEPKVIWCFSRIPGFSHRQGLTGMHCIFRHPGIVTGSLALLIDDKMAGAWAAISVKGNKKVSSTGNFSDKENTIKAFTHIIKIVEAHPKAVLNMDKMLKGSNTKAM
ncbi:MAG: hypothetical protein ACYTFY_20320 [Planctomycetota bacterium]|jgi:hypothetical protein